MAGEAIEQAPEEEGTAIPTSGQRRKKFSPFLSLGAALRRGSAEPRPVKLARLGVSGQGSEREVTAVPPLSDPRSRCSTSRRSARGSPRRPDLLPQHPQRVPLRGHRAAPFPDRARPARTPPGLHGRPVRTAPRARPRHETHRAPPHGRPPAPGVGARPEPDHQGPDPLLPRTGLHRLWGHRSADDR